MKKYDNPRIFIIYPNPKDIIQSSGDIVPDGEYELPIIRPNSIDIGGGNNV